jgi:hypothetical protein
LHIKSRWFGSEKKRKSVWHHFRFQYDLLYVFCRCSLC